MDRFPETKARLLLHRFFLLSYLDFYVFIPHFFHYDMLILGNKLHFIDPIGQVRTWRIRESMVGDSCNRGITDRQNTSTPRFSAPPRHNILEHASIRSTEQKERYKTYRKLFELMVVVISYKGWKVVGFWWRQIKYQPILVCITKHESGLLSTSDCL